jgi:murein DD-endopeptidase MepM/ murein hydrolase activator NlpD
MDIAAPEGTPVFAPNNGRVVMAERLLNTGNTIVIEHGGGLKSYYFHLSRIDVTPEDRVEKGALIGAVGSTGYSTGPHLHYEMRIGNRPINPSMLFEADAGLYSAE